jgi:protein involved in ribonucleotide reduction
MNKQILKDLAKYFRLKGHDTFVLKNTLFVEIKTVYNRSRTKIISQYVPVFISDNGNICSLEANEYVSDQVKNFLERKYNEQSY